MAVNEKEKSIKAQELKNYGLKSAAINFLYNYFKIVIFLAGSSVLAVGYLFLVMPKYSQIKDNIKAVNDAREIERNDMQDYYNKLNLYRRNYNSISEADKNRINTMLPGGSEIEIVIAEMENLIVSKGMLLKSLKVSSDKKSPANTARGAAPSPQNKKPGNISTINIDADIDGVNYRGLKMLLDTFESNLRILDINEIDFSPGTETLKLKIAAYCLDLKD